MELTRRQAMALITSGVAGLSASPASAQMPVNVRVGAGVDTGFTPFLYAQQAELFKKAGLDIQLQGGANGAALAAGVAGGTLDFAKSALMPLINARARGLPFKIVAGATQDSVDASVNFLCTLKTSGIKSLADVAGKTIAFSTLKGLDMLGAQVLLNQSGVDPSSVKFIELRSAAMFAALEQGRADVTSTAYPFVTAELDSGKVVTLGDPYRGIGRRLMIASWFTTDAYILQNRAVVDRFAKVIRDASTYANTHHEETASMLAAYAHLDPGTVMALRNFTFATRLEPAEIQPAIDAAAKYGYIEEAFPAKDLIL